MDGMMKASLQQATKEKPLSADEQAVLDRQQAKMAGVMKEELSWNKMKDLYARPIAKCFPRRRLTD
jgi:hypothetical protein